MFDKLEKHNNKKVTYVINRRLNLIKNTITYYLNPEHDNKKDDIIDALKVFNVECKQMNNDKTLVYMKNVFNV